MLATLPHHISSWKEIEAISLQLELFLRSWTTMRGMQDLCCNLSLQAQLDDVNSFHLLLVFISGCAPEAICIARSDGDGFTDCNQVRLRYVIDLIEKSIHIKFRTLSNDYVHSIILCCCNVQG